MADVVHTTVAWFLFSIANHQTNNKQKNTSILFGGPLYFVAIDIPLSLTKTNGRNNHIVVVTDQYSYLREDIPTATTTATRIFPILVKHWVFNFCTQSTVRTDDGPQFTSKIFATQDKELAVKTEQLHTSYRSTKPLSWARLGWKLLDYRPYALTKLA